MADKIAIVTGTSSGVGKALSEHLARHDWTVIGIARRSVQIEDAGYHHICHDLADWEKTERRLIPQLEMRLCASSWQRVALVNNAADPGQMRLLPSLKGGPLHDLFGTNVIAPMLLMGMFLRTVPQGTTTRIVNVSSGAATGAFPALSDYGASKASLRLAGMVAAVEAQTLEGRDFALLSYSPGVVDTPMQAFARAQHTVDFPLADRFREFQATGSLISPEAVAADLAPFLEGDAPLGFSERRYGESTAFWTAGRANA